MKFKNLVTTLLCVFIAFSSLCGQSDSAKQRPGAEKVAPGVAAQVQPGNLNVVNGAPALDTVQENPTPVNYTNPDSFFAPNALMALQTAVFAILGYLGGFIPKVRTIKSGYIRSGVVIFAAATAFATFKTAVFTQDFFTTLVSTFFPSFPFANAAYSLVKTVLEVFGIKIPKPATNGKA